MSIMFTFGLSSHMCQNQAILIDGCLIIYEKTKNTEHLYVKINTKQCLLTWAPKIYLSIICPPSVWPPISHTCIVTLWLPKDKKI